METDCSQTLSLSAVDQYPQKYHNKQLANGDVESVPTNDLPATTDTSFEAAQEGSLFYMANNCVAPPPAIHANVQTFQLCLGWVNNRTVVQFAKTWNVNTHLLVALIFHLCYTSDHTAPQCLPFFERNAHDCG